MLLNGKTTRHIFASAALLMSFVVYSSDEHALSFASPGGKPATQATIEANRRVAEQLNYEDRRAFEQNAVGLVASFDKKTADVIHSSFDFIDLLL